MTTRLWQWVLDRRQEHGTNRARLARLCNLRRIESMCGYRWRLSGFDARNRPVWMQNRCSVLLPQMTFSFPLLGGPHEHDYCERCTMLYYCGERVPVTLYYRDDHLAHLVACDHRAYRRELDRLFSDRERIAYFSEASVGVQYV